QPGDDAPRPPLRPERGPRRAPDHARRRRADGGAGARRLTEAAEPPFSNGADRSVAWREWPRRRGCRARERPTRSTPPARREARASPRRGTWPSAPRPSGVLWLPLGVG